MTPSKPPPDAEARRAGAPVVAYDIRKLPVAAPAFYDNARAGMSKIGETIVPPRQARAFEVPAGHLFRIVSVEGPQVGDLNLWNAANLAERFFSGKTRALHATHLSTGDRLWSALPYLRPMATITHDTWDGDGRRRRSRRDRHALRSLHQSAADRRRLSPLLPLEPDARPGGETGDVLRSGRAACSRRHERLHVHRLHPRRTSLLHEG